jgi:hypothetical protein
LHPCHHAAREILQPPRDLGVAGHRIEQHLQVRRLVDHPQGAVRKADTVAVELGTDRHTQVEEALQAQNVVVLKPSVEQGGIVAGVGVQGGAQRAARIARRVGRQHAISGVQAQQTTALRPEGTDGGVARRGPIVEARSRRRGRPSREGVIENNRAVAGHGKGIEFEHRRLGLPGKQGQTEDCERAG